ncbi:ARM repeat-containing protein [Pholiota conissans]|uniref:ARM repeat-containing protein n=1 Tax=Pholiota conissans TaxID=109636 RepID=A0A9P6D080_9AGAR|nr:ARM repeat-containing protein [Pholiota conissans]
MDILYKALVILGVLFLGYYYVSKRANPPSGVKDAPCRWSRKALIFDADSPEMVNRKVKGLLNKLTMKKFNSISDQIITWANEMEGDKKSHTLIRISILVFEKAMDEAGMYAEMYARLCRKIVEQTSLKMQDDDIRDYEGKPFDGGQPFRDCLFILCWVYIEWGRMAKQTIAPTAVAKVDVDRTVNDVNAKYYAAQKAKRQGLGLIKFIGELFKLQVLTEHVMHEYVKKLLDNIDNPEEEVIESLCKLLTTVGEILDHPESRAHLDVYFSRMKQLMKSPNINSRMQYMLLDVIELRERKWVSRTSVASLRMNPRTSEMPAKERFAPGKLESYSRQISMSLSDGRTDESKVGPNALAASDGSDPKRPPKAGKKRRKKKKENSSVQEPAAGQTRIQVQSNELHTAESLEVSLSNPQKALAPIYSQSTQILCNDDSPQNPSKALPTPNIIGPSIDDLNRSDIDVIKHHVRILVNRLKENQKVNKNAQQLGQNGINSISVMDDEGGNIIAIVNLIINMDSGA